MFPTVRTAPVERVMATRRKPKKGASVLVGITMMPLASSFAVWPSEPPLMLMAVLGACGGSHAPQ